ncbi:helix-turn-helix domain-containing protein [Sinimarinibacterium flocculans]|uniref:helix-turn-helix domain-containing protein n=1 Tax=Sinimarinibacterium flocculans TaxID=985250 RepID=UPI002493C96F|nr:AraC family transcriptional regulator [Sinimarinibacterium flocculans]
MVRASGLRGYRALMHALGADAAMMLERYRISAELLDDDDALLPLRSAALLLEASAAATHCADFGLRLAQIQDISVLGPVAIAMQNAPTVAGAVDIASRYLFVHSPGMALSVHPRSALAAEAVEVRFELTVQGLASLRQTFDVCLGDVHQMIALLAGPHYDLRAVTLPHTPIAPLSTYARFYGAPVHAAQPHGGLHIARSTFEAGLQDVNAALRQLAEDYLALHFSDPGQTVSARVRQALRRTLGTPENSRAGVAQLLGLHPRTLQRRLAAEHCSFEALREDVRRETALRYLCETRIPLSQLAGLLGLSEQSALTRSCRRWFGTTPSALRRRAAASPSVPLQP